VRNIDSSSKYYYPLTKKTINGIFEKVFKPLVAGRNVNFRVARKFGGAMTIIRFLVSEVEMLAENTGIDISKDDYKFIIMDPNDLIEGSKRAYMEMLYEKTCRELGVKLESVRDVTDSELFTLIKEILGKAAKEYNVIFILRGLGFLEFGDQYLWGNLKNIRPKNEPFNHVRFVFVTYLEAPYQVSDERFMLIQDFLSENIVDYNKISEEDIEYSIDRWQYVLEKKFNKKEKDAIKKVSNGYPYLLKYTSFALDNRPSNIEPEEFLKRNALIKDILSVIHGKKTLEINVESGDISVDGKSVVACFSPREYNVLMLLASKKDKIVDRDSIAQVVWPGESAEMYSDWAISQLIKRLRKKLEEKEVGSDCIKTIHGRGYMYQESN
jgi:hypothetical protein